MDVLYKALDILKIIFLLVATQMVGVFGVFLIFSLVLHQVEKFITNVYGKTIGWKGILWTAWLGTPIHELGHVLFALAFFHQIKEVKLYEPDEETGTLGYVDSAYNPKNLYHQVGRFFVGVGPLIIGSFAVFAALYFLVPNSREVIAPLVKTAGVYNSEIELLFQLKVFGITAIQTLKVLFATENLTDYKFWIFLYIAICITSHMAPSIPDIKGSGAGLLTIFLLLIVINVIALLFGYDLTSKILSVNRYLGAFVALFALAIIISIAHWLLSYLVLGTYFKIRWGRMISPF